MVGADEEQRRREIKGQNQAAQQQLYSLSKEIGELNTRYSNFEKSKELYQQYVIAGIYSLFIFDLEI